MKYSKNILETIGNTPLVKLNKITADIEALVLAKVEYFNPGSSVKDRIAIKMIEDAENDGRLKPGGTIVEGTSRSPFLYYVNNFFKNHNYYVKLKNINT